MKRIVLLLAALLALGVSPAGAVPLGYLQTWEVTPHGWTSVHGPGDPVNIVSDVTAPSFKRVHKIDRIDTSGNYESPNIPLIPGQRYCIGTWVRWVSGGWPFLGFHKYTTAGRQSTDYWMVGMPNYFYGITGVDSADPNWRWYGNEWVAEPDTLSIRLTTELWSTGKGGAPLAYFDDISVTPGRCAPAVIYEETWELGADGWAPREGATGPVATILDYTAPSTVRSLELTQLASSGQLESPNIPVTPGQTYCIGAWIDWVGGGWPFVGFHRYTSNGIAPGDYWMIGMPNYFFGITGVDINASGWQWYTKTWVAEPGTTSIRLDVELWTAPQWPGKPGQNLAYMDNITVFEGACPAYPPL